MKKTIGMLAVLGMIMSCQTLLGNEELRLYDLKERRTIEKKAVQERLQRAKVIIVGEHHAMEAHHQAQLAVIQHLVESGKRVAIGLEMFRRGSQNDLDRWVAGEIDEARFKPIYLDNWNFDWSIYRPIFHYARAHKIPMIGLNVDRSLSKQVAYSGFDSLSDDQKRILGPVTCDVTPAYRNYIREAYDAHVHGGMQFDYFCEAQLLWDTAMAIYASHYLEAHPETILVILTGAGHAQKQAIPAQLAKRAPWPTIVLLPETPGAFEPDLVGPGEADYLIRL